MAKNEKKGGDKQRSRVLSDHQQVGKRFIPPMQQLGPWKDANWIGSILPELLWIGLLNDHHGLKRGAELSLSLARAAAQASGVDPKEFNKKFGKAPKHWFALTSAYNSLNQEQQLEVVKCLRPSSKLDQLRKALAPLDEFYPKFPLRFLFEDMALNEKAKDLERLKTLLQALFDKYEKPATFVLANAIYIAFCTNRMKVFEVLALSRFPAIEHFPETEDSRVVAAAVRSAVNGMWGFEEQSHDWSDYFWNRGLELEACDYKRIYETYE
jgi:hypothetical protein